MTGSDNHVEKSIVTGSEYHVKKSIPSDAFACFLISYLPAEPHAAEKQLLEHVLPARNTWGKRIREFTVIAPNLNYAREAQPLIHETYVNRTNANRLVLKKFCRFVMNHKSPLQHHFVEYTCQAEHGQFRYLLVDCAGYEEERHVGLHSASCKVDHAVEFMMKVQPEKFKSVQWVGLGDDDIGYQESILEDFLGHYDYKDRIVLNPAAENIEQQRSAEGPMNVKWNLNVRKCNPFMPERFMGAVVSRGLLEVAQDDYANGALEHLAAVFGSSPDCVSGVLWWMHGAKFVPMGLSSRDNEDMRSRVAHGGNGGVMIAHRLRSKEEFEVFEGQESSVFPTPEALPGPQYNNSMNYAQNGMDIFKLTEENCGPQHSDAQSRPMEINSGHNGA